jgi:hypothetical protein
MPIETDSAATDPRLSKETNAVLIGSGSSDCIVPALIAGAGDAAGWRYVEFFTANIRNPHTRRAYARAFWRTAARSNTRRTWLRTPARARPGSTIGVKNGSHRRRWREFGCDRRAAKFKDICI